MNVYAFGEAPLPAPVEAEAKQKLMEFGLAVEQLHQDANDILALEAGCDTEEFIRRLVDEAPPADSVQQAPRTDADAAVLTKIDRVLRCPADDAGPDSTSQSLCGTISARLAVRAGARAEAFLESIRQMVDCPATRVEGARKFATTVMRLLQEMRQRLTAQAARLRDTAATFSVEADAKDGERREKFRMFVWPKRQKNPTERRRRLLSGYARNRLDEAVCHAVARQIQSTELRVATLVEQLTCLSQRLDVLARPFAGMPEETSADESETGATARLIAGYQQMVLEQLNLNQHELSHAMERAIDESVLAGAQGLRRFLEPGCEPQDLLSRPLAEAARFAVLDCLTSIVCQFIQEPPVAAGDKGPMPFVDLLHEALATGGDVMASRANDRFLIVPQAADLALVRERIQSALPGIEVVGGPTCDITLCGIRDGVPLKQLAREMIGGIDAFEELAGRLHTRIDIEWTPLSGAEPVVGQAADNPSGAPLVTHTAVIPVSKP